MTTPREFVEVLKAQGRRNFFPDETGEFGNTTEEVRGAFAPLIEEGLISEIMTVLDEEDNVLWEGVSYRFGYEYELEEVDGEFYCYALSHDPVFVCYRYMISGEGKIIVGGVPEGEEWQIGKTPQSVEFVEVAQKWLNAHAHSISTEDYYRICGDIHKVQKGQHVVLNESRLFFDKYIKGEALPGLVPLNIGR